jgi:acetyltransferase-like isoleucine patch superfamily enzyme
LLGAKIGGNVTISPEAVLGEYDLLDIGDNVLLDGCICRPFACERNSSMFLGRIVIGKNARIGLKSLVSPGSVLPDDTFIGPNSASHEINPLDDSHGSINGLVPEFPTLLSVLVIYLAKILVIFLSSIPWMVGYYGMATKQPSVMSDGVKNIITWWASPRRIAFRYLTLTLDNIVGPFFWFAALVGIRILIDRVIGSASPHSAEDRTQTDIFRRNLMEILVPRGDLKRITRLFGLHYEFTSMAIRALGGKVGKNIYWPGQGPEIQDFNLITVGNDVVFGSRSFVVTSDSLGSAPVEIQDGAMVGDRVILSPGSTIGKNTLLGSGALAKRHQTYAADTVWLGNRDGGPVSLTKAPNESGRWTLNDHYEDLSPTPHHRALLIRFRSLKLIASSMHLRRPSCHPPLLDEHFIIIKLPISCSTKRQYFSTVPVF